MSKIEIKDREVKEVFERVSTKSKEAVKSTLIAFYPVAGKDVRKIKNTSIGRSNKKGKNVPQKSKDGVPYKSIRDSLADPYGKKIGVGFERQELENGVLYRPKVMTSYGNQWIKNMEEGGYGIPGKAAVRFTAIQIGDRLVSESKKRKHNK